MRDLEHFIPFREKKFRIHQEDTVNNILDIIDDGVKYIILNAPVGSGKSLIAYVIAKYLETKNKETYFCTGTKILQDQYINDFKDVKTIKGRNNFYCAEEPLVNCANGMCQTRSKYRCYNKPVLKGEWEFGGEPLTLSSFEENDFNMCPYWQQKVEGMLNPLTMLNYDYLISDIRFAQHLYHRDFLVCDEGHNIEKILMRQLEVKFSPKTVNRETGVSLDNLNTIEDWIIPIRDISLYYKEKMKQENNDSKKMKLQEKYEKFSILHSLISDDPSNWVVIKEKNFGHLFCEFKPITVSNYTNLIFGIADHCLIMTGTVLKQDVFAKDLGIDDYEYIEIPSIIPIQNRPIVKSYVGSMARSSIDSTMPNMIAKVKILADKHCDEKGVIHTFTYNIARQLKRGLKSDRFIFHTQDNKEYQFEEFKKDKTNKILVSPVAFEGIDFPYDEARWQCICKDPFPNIGDLQIKVRDMVDYGWLFRQRCLVLSQMYGRTNRAPDDYSVTYLLDSRIETLLGDSSLVTDYFLEAIDGTNYTTRLQLNDRAYDKLTKDNNRKNHEFDRKVERNILQDIESGIDTLCDLRKAYKVFSSDAYKYISPAVNRLLKHGAISYVE